MDSSAVGDKGRRPSLSLGMRIGPALLLLQAIFATASVAGEERMYVIASEPFPNRYMNDAPAILYRVDLGRLEKIRTITTARQDTLFVQPYPDQGYVFVGSVGARAGAFLLDVVDLRTVGVERTLDLDGCWGCNARNHRNGCMGCRYATSQLLNREGQLIYMIQPGIWYGEQLDCSCRNLGVDVVTGEAASGLGTGALRFAYEAGSSGGLVDGGDFGADIYAEENRAIAWGRGEAEAEDLGWELPPDLILGSDSWGDSARLIVNNDQMRVVVRVPFNRPDTLAAATMFYVFDKATAEWATLELPGSGVPKGAQTHYVETLDTSGTYFPMRAIREWLAAEEIYRYEPGAMDMERLAKHQFGPFSSVAERIGDYEAAPTGRFHLYNVRTKDLIVHDTREPDSEVLYVDEDDFAWFRVSDELRRARIEDGKLGRPEVVVKTPEMWAVHWLFFGRE